MRSLIRPLVALSVGECGTHPWVRKIKERDRVIMTVGVGLHVVELKVHNFKLSCVIQIRLVFHFPGLELLDRIWSHIFRIVRKTKVST